jgi:hypothetical protein
MGFGDCARAKPANKTINPNARTQTFFVNGHDSARTMNFSFFRNRKQLAVPVIVIAAE